MNDKIRSILPVSASRAERVVDSTAGDMLADIAVCLIRYVKNPDLCPTELLPWLAWEMSVDTWNDTWTETEKRAAIKRAAYIHRHRGTKAALTESLSDSPFRSQIVEWYEQTPPGDPYTFRLNVEQKDLPVLMSDHQDLKHAVLRAKNLRSWFSIHVYGNSRGNGYGYGYVTATEKLKNKIMPSQILLSPDSVQLAPGETASVQVTILPLIAEDRSFTVHLADERVAGIQVDGDVITLTGRQYGATTVSVTTSNGVTATLTVRVVSLACFVMRVDSVSRPLFFINDAGDTAFTLDYGDGVPCRDFTVRGNSVFPAQEITPGQELTITVRGCDSLAFYHYAGGTSSPLLEIIRVSGPRTSMEQFANMQGSLRKIHAGAFDGLPYVISFAGAFRGCTALNDLPENLFAGCSQVTTFARTFYGCTRLVTAPDGMFSFSSAATDFSQLFYGCTALVHVPDDLLPANGKTDTLMQTFYNCRQLARAPRIPVRNLTSLYQTFYNCTALSDLPEFIPDEGVGQPLITLEGTFMSCRGLSRLPSGHFDVIKTRIRSLRQAFYGCTGILTVPDRLFAGMTACRNISSCMQGCTAVTTVGESLFEGAIALTECVSVFAGCTSVTETGGHLFAGAISLTACVTLFENCSSLERVGGGMLSGCAALETANALFRNCRALPRLPDDTLAGCINLTTTYSLFEGCISLGSIQTALFADSAIRRPEGMFNGCSSLYDVPPGLIVPGNSAVSLSSVFRGCTALSMDINTLFPQAFPAGCGLALLFQNCSRVTGSRSVFMAKFPEPSSVSGMFDNCPQLTD